MSIEMQAVRSERAPFDPNAESVALETFKLMERGSREDFDRLIHPDMVNHEAKDEPPAARQRHGPAAAYATAVWLREAFADLDWEIHDVVAEGDLAVVHCTMSGRQVGDFVGFDTDASVAEAFPATGKPFATTQTHWLRVNGGLVMEHWANRDDLGMAMQLGWAPPTPSYLARMALAKRRARRRYS